MAAKTKTMKALRDNESGVIVAYETLIPVEACINGKKETLPAGTVVTGTISSGAHYMWPGYDGRKLLNGPHRDWMAEFPVGILRV